MAYSNRTPEEQAEIDQRKYRAWNELRAGVGAAAQEFRQGLTAGAQGLLPRWDFRSPGAAFTPERTHQVIQDFRSSLPGPEAGKPTFGDRNSFIPSQQRAQQPAQQPNVLNAMLQQSPIPGPRVLTGQGLIPQRMLPAAAEPSPPASASQAEGGEPRRDGASSPPNAADKAPDAQGAAETGQRAYVGITGSTPDSVRGTIGQGKFEVSSRDNPAGVDRVVRGLGLNPQGLPMTGWDTRASGGAPIGQPSAAPSAPTYDPDQLAAAQFGRIKYAADTMMEQARGMFDSNPMKVPTIQAAHTLYSQLGGANNAGVMAGSGIAQEGIRGDSARAVQRLLNEGGLGLQQARDSGALGLQQLTGQQAIDLETLRNQGLQQRENTVSDREFAKLAAERQDKAAERMPMTTYEPTTGFPAGQVPTPKYVYGEPQKQQAGPQAGMIYAAKDGKRYRFNGGDPNDPKSYTVMP